MLICPNAYAINKAAKSWKTKAQAIKELNKIAKNLMKQSGKLK